HIRAIVIAGFSGLVSELTELAEFFDGLDVGITICGDVYSALAEIVAERQVGETLLVVGSLTQLCAEDMRFLEICAGRDDTSCCCFVNDRAGYDIKKVLQVLGTKAYLAAELSDLASILTEIGTVENALQEECSSEQRNIDKKEFALTRAEMDALCRAG
ncbi:MAG: hypothetical protein KAT00_13050, partial [Planctomycetes bacterium]|nr:hypothetical protein [Planctomycetota bacterium]